MRVYTFLFVDRLLRIWAVSTFCLLWMGLLGAFWTACGHTGFQFSPVDIILLFSGPSSGVPQTRSGGPAPLMCQLLGLDESSSLTLLICAMGM